MKKYKVIIDTDPGCDDTLAIIMAMNNPKLDIKLFTTVAGNIGIDIATRNMCFILDIFKKDYPVAKGAKKAMKRISEDASFLHDANGLGGYIPPKTTLHQPIEEDCVEAMYRVIKENPNEIVIIAIGPHTNLGNLFTKHPDAKKLVKMIVYEGCAPFGLPNDPEYNSFNAKTDPEAQKIVLESGIPVVMTPSNIGRYKTHFTEEMIKEFPFINDTTRFLHKTCETYWEPDAPDMRIATNDTCPVFYLDDPSIFKTKKAFVSMDCNEHPGRARATFDKNGPITIIVDVNRKRFFKLLYKTLHKLDKFKMDSEILDNEIQLARRLDLEKKILRRQKLLDAKEEKAEQNKKNTNKTKVQKKKTK